MTAKTWNHRGHRLKRLEWGLWRDLDRPGKYFLCYRPRGRNGPVVRRWATTVGGLTVTKLKTHVRRIRAEIEAKKLGRRPDYSPDRAVEEYLGELARKNRSASHIATTASVISRFRGFTDGAPQRTTPADVEAFLAGLATDGLSPRTQNKYRTYLHGWFGWALRSNLIDSNPVTSVSPAGVKRAFKRFPEPKEFTWLAGKVPLRDARIWTLFALTGLRRGSILSLGNDCFGRDGIIVPHTKEGRERFLAYDDGCPLWGAELTRLGLAIWQEAPLTMWEIRQASERAKALGWEYTPHSLRHAFCSWLAMTGENLQDIAAWAGHSTVMTTEKWYAHRRPKGRDRMARNRADVFTMRSQALGRCLDDITVTIDSAGA